jgi:hypothetical protein
VRDPAAYVKRDELATPAGIDRDFNFLVGVERQLERSERDLADRGLPAALALPPYAGGGAPNGAYSRGRKNKWSKGDEALQQSAVTVEKAPLGLQRQKENRTRWDNQ